MALQPPTPTTGLVLAATPLGDVRDASAHLVELLRQAAVVAAEDTRKLTALTRRLGVKVTGRVVSLHEHNEDARIDQLLQAARHSLVVVVSDAGTPLVSDPGFALTRQAIRDGVDLRVAPGPSAVTTALLLSGLPADRFVFEGFLPRQTRRRARIEELAQERRTVVLFESARRLAGTLGELAAALGGGRQAAVCREMTKQHQEVMRGSLAELAVWAGQGVLGEVTVVVAGAGGTDLGELPAGAVDQVLAQVEGGLGLKEAVAAVAGQHGGSRRLLYQAALERRAAAGPAA